MPQPGAARSHKQKRRKSKHKSKKQVAAAAGVPADSALAGAEDAPRSEPAVGVRAEPRDAGFLEQMLAKFFVRNIPWFVARFYDSFLAYLLAKPAALPLTVRSLLDGLSALPDVERGLVTRLTRIFHSSERLVRATGFLLQSATATLLARGGSSSNVALHELSDSLEPVSPQLGGILCSVSQRQQAFPGLGLKEAGYRLFEASVCGLVCALQEIYVRNWLQGHSVALAGLSPAAAMDRVDLLLCHELYHAHLSSMLLQTGPKQSSAAEAKRSSSSSRVPAANATHVAQQLLRAANAPAVDNALGSSARKTFTGRAQCLQNASSAYYDVVYVQLVRPSTEQPASDMLSSVRYCAGLAAAWTLRDESGMETVLRYLLEQCPPAHFASFPTAVQHTVQLIAENGEWTTPVGSLLARSTATQLLDKLKTTTTTTMTSITAATTTTGQLLDKFSAACPPQPRAVHSSSSSSSSTSTTTTTTTAAAAAAATTTTTTTTKDLDVPCVADREGVQQCLPVHSTERAAGCAAEQDVLFLPALSGQAASSFVQTVAARLSPQDLQLLAGTVMAGGQSLLQRLEGDCNGDAAALQALAASDLSPPLGKLKARQLAVALRAAGTDQGATGSARSQSPSTAPHDTESTNSKKRTKKKKKMLKSKSGGTESTKSKKKKKKKRKTKGKNGKLKTKESKESVSRPKVGSTATGTSEPEAEQELATRPDGSEAAIPEPGQDFSTEAYSSREEAIRELAKEWEAEDEGELDDLPSTLEPESMKDVFASFMQATDRVCHSESESKEELSDSDEENASLETYLTQVEIEAHQQCSLPEKDSDTRPRAKERESSSCSFSQCHASLNGKRALLPCRLGCNEVYYCSWKCVALGWSNDGHKNICSLAVKSISGGPST
eukprot:g15882.t1